MKKSSPFPESAQVNPRLLIALLFCSTGAFLMLLGFGGVAEGARNQNAVLFQSVASYHHDVSAPLRHLALLPAQTFEHESNVNPKIPFHHKDSVDPVVQRPLKSQLGPIAPSMPSSILSFLGIGFPGVSCNCHPPDTNGAIGATQYVQIVNEGYQVFNKSTGASVLGPVGISSLWTGFGGVCQSSGQGDPVVLYDHLANRWVITQFAGNGSAVTDECVAVSTTSDATGTYNRYGFHLGTNFFDYPKLGVWPDAYYMSMNVFNAAGTSYLGPQPFALNRTAMLAGNAATFVSPAAPLGGSVDPILPADVDGPTLPPNGAPETFVGFPGNGVYNVYHFHVDFATPANSTWSTFASPPAAGFTQLCPSTSACVPQAGVSASDYLDGLADRLMFRLPYRNFGDHESVVGNYTVSAGGVAGIRWFELRNVTSGPVTKFQESTYQPDSTWRWMGSAAMDGAGNLAIGYSASSASINPGIRYAGRLATDPLNTLAQGEATLIAGTGSQTGGGNRWGDYSAMTVDPVDDSTFWYTTEYYVSTGASWQTRIGSFKFSPGSPTPTPTPTATPAPTPNSVVIAALGTAVCENFNTLASSGTSSVTPAGWSFSETGTNANTTYTAGTGSGTAGDTYSFGATGAADRAFGGLQSGSLVPTFGAVFTNQTGQTITSLLISYTGEQWRLGTSSRSDRLDFQISTDATSLTTGTWTDANALDFTAPTQAGAVGALDGNAAANRTSITSSITGLSLSNGATFWIRWNSFDAPGADDGLAIDDFCLTADGGTATQPPSITNGPPPSPVIVGTAYSFTFTATGSPAPTFSITGTLPPGLTLSPGGTLSGTATSGGTGSFAGLMVMATNGIAPTAMQTFDLTTVTRAQNYLTGYGLSGNDAVFTFDYDGDGLANLLEYGLNLNPTVAGLNGLPVVNLKDYSGTKYLSMTFNRSALATDLTYIVQASSDLMNWDDLGTSSAGAATTGTGFIGETGSAPGFAVEVRDVVPYDPNAMTKRFIRLKITSP